MSGSDGSGFQANLHSSTSTTVVAPGSTSSASLSVGGTARSCEAGESLIMCELLKAKEFSKKLSKSKDESPRATVAVGGRTIGGALGMGMRAKSVKFTN